MAETSPRPAVCPETALHGHDWAWRCVLAAGHDGDHRPPVEAAYVSRPLREMDREQLVQAAALAFETARSARRDATVLNRHLQHREAQVTQVAAHVLDGVKGPHGNNHTTDCWTKHPHCLAFALIGCGGLDRAMQHLTDSRQVAS